jgi:hypothetical protein
VIVTVKNLPTIVIQPGESIGLGLPGEARMASFKRSTPSADCIVKDGKRLDVTGKKTGAFSFRVPYSIGTKQLETTLRGKVVSEVTSLPLALEVATTKELAPLAVNSQLKCVAGEFLEVKNVQNAGIASVTLKEKAVTVSGLAAGTTKAWLVYKGVPAKEREKPEELLTIVTLDITVE